MGKFNKNLKESDLQDLEYRIRAGLLSRQAAADIVGVTAPVMCRWITDSSGCLWERYKKLRSVNTLAPLNIRRVVSPEWGEQTYEFCADKLEISVPSFAKRLRKHGADSPRVWVKGKLVEHGRKSTPEERALGQPRWEGLPNRSRDANLSKIPGPTKYERSLYALV